MACCLCAVQRTLMSRHLSSSGCRATPLELSPHLLLNHGLVTTSTPPWSGSCLLGTRWWTPLSQAWLWMALHMYTRHKVRHRLCVVWSQGWLATWLRSKAELAKVVLDTAHEEAPDPRRPLDAFYDKTGSLAIYQLEVSLWLGPTCSQCVRMYSTLGYELGKLAVCANCQFSCGWLYHVCAIVGIYL